MSYIITITVSCDGGCGKSISNIGTAVSQNGPTYWDIKREMMGLKWITMTRGRYHTPKHFCPTCADKSPVPAKAQRRAS